MRFFTYLLAVASVFIFSGQALAHPGHETQTSLHHVEGLLLLAAMVVAIVATYFISKAPLRSKKKTANLDKH